MVESVYLTTDFGLVIAKSGVWPVVWINGRGYIPKAPGDALLARGTSSEAAE